MEKHKSGSVLWQLQQNIQAKKLLIKAADDDIGRATLRREEAINELADYEAAYYTLLNARAEG